MQQLHKSGNVFGAGGLKELLEAAVPAALRKQQGKVACRLQLG